MSMEEFIDYYENHHSKLGIPMMPLARRYVRRYVKPEPNPITGEVVELPFDVVMELWWNSREDYETTMKSLGEGENFKLIYEDEERIFASHDNPVFTVEECDSELPNGVAGTVKGLEDSL
ncbi:MAG: EthD domain-containing protein [Novosphingobium sp.]